MWRTFVCCKIHGVIRHKHILISASLMFKKKSVLYMNRYMCMWMDIFSLVEDACNQNDHQAMHPSKRPVKLQWFSSYLELELLLIQACKWQIYIFFNHAKKKKKKRKKKRKCKQRKRTWVSLVIIFYLQFVFSVCDTWPHWWKKSSLSLSLSPPPTIRQREREI